MRLKGLTLAGFRAFGLEQDFDLEADAVILVGPNGSGKSSLCDAVLWGLTGRLPRVTDQDGSVLSEFSETGEARVELRLGAAGDDLKLVRSFDGDSDRLQVQVNQDSPLRGTAAKAILLARMEPLGLVSESPIDSITTAITRCVYLQQDLVREFVEADSDRERFDAISDLVGTGQVTQLQVRLEKAKAAWTKATNSRKAEAEPLTRQLASLADEIERLGDPESRAEDLEAQWATWWTAVGDMTDGGSPPPADGSAGAAELDQALKQLTARYTVVTNQLSTSRELSEGLGAWVSRTRGDASKALGEIQAEVTKLDKRISEISASLAQAEDAAAAMRREQVETRERQEQLAAMAELALQHLGDACPVCSQAIDPSEVEAHLRGLVELGQRTNEVSPGQETSVTQIAQDLEASERQRTELEQSAVGLRREVSDRRAWDTEKARLVEALGIADAPDAELAPQVASRIDVLTGEGARLRELLSDGEGIALLLARASQTLRRRELSHERDLLQERVDAVETEIRERRRTGDTAQELLEALRDANSTLVRRDIDKLRPLLDRIYSRIDPHPAFQRITLDTTIHGGRGRVQPEATDPVAGVTTRAPSAVFSSSQLNALAVAIFVTLNLGIDGVPLETMVLDDPLQSVDDVNLLSLIDLFRRAKKRRQLIVTTHDPRFGNLLERKLRPVENETTRVFRFSGWDREGPVVQSYDVDRDSAPMKLATAGSA